MEVKVIETKTFYVIKEIEGRAENNYHAEYQLQKEKPANVKDGWEMKELQIEVTDKPQNFIILDKDQDNSFYGAVSLKTTNESFEDVMNVVHSIDGYTSDDLWTILFSCIEGEEIDIAGTVYF